jgi:UDP-N-acetylmuramoylalanine--D-glutamate ligase
MSTRWRVGIIGMARSGRAAALLALVNGHEVYVTDSADTPALRKTADALREEGAQVELGSHSIETLASCDLLVVSPGVPPTIPALQDPRVRKVRRVSELEFAFWFLNCPVIAVTGTNGKSTTTALIAHVLRRAGLDAPAAGNIGLALSEIAVRPEQPDWVVVEASSFQLADIERFTPRIGVVTNLSPDHLDRYESVDDYYADKARLFENSNPYSVWVLNGDDPATVQLPGSAQGRRFYFRTSGELKKSEVGGFVSEAGALVLRLGSMDTELVQGGELQLLGRHNQANALAAMIVAAAAEVPLDAIHDGLVSFRGLPHRLEIVRELDGVLWINDSKATNIASTKVALDSMTRPTVLLLGGKHKGEPYTELLPQLGQHAKCVIAYGESAPIIEQDLHGQVALERVHGSFEEVVERAAAVAQVGDVVLLSPACSSFDMFANYEQRGDQFKALVAELTQAVNG